MRRVFADSMYWIALASPRDQWHAKANQIDINLDGVQLITTQEALIEFLTHFCEQGHYIRQGRHHRSPDA